MDTHTHTKKIEVGHTFNGTQVLLLLEMKRGIIVANIVERFFERPKTKTKAISLSNHSVTKWANQISTQVQEAGAQRGKLM